MASKVEKFKEFDALPFEDALKRLESIVARMEDGKAPLEELLERFEEGGYLAQLCQKRLDALQKRIEILVKDSPQGAKWKQFDPDKDEAPETPEEAEDSDDEAPDEKPSPEKHADDDILF